MRTYIFEDDNGRDKLVLDNGEIKVFEVSSKKGFLEFYRLPWSVYQEDPLWVPHLWREYHSFKNL